jgi:archaellum component FlaC
MDSHQNCTTTTDQKLEQILSELKQLRHKVEINAKDIEWLQERFYVVEDVETDIEHMRSDLDTIEGKVWDIEHTVENMRGDVEYLRSTHL